MAAQAKHSRDIKDTEVDEAFGADLATPDDAEVSTRESVAHRYPVVIQQLTSKNCGDVSQALLSAAPHTPTAAVINALLKQNPSFIQNEQGEHALAILMKGNFRKDQTEILQGLLTYIQTNKITAKDLSVGGQPFWLFAVAQATPENFEILCDFIAKEENAALRSMLNPEQTFNTVENLRYSYHKETVVVSTLREPRKDKRTEIKTFSNASCSSLHVAALRKEPEIVQRILALDPAQHNAKNTEGKTPLETVIASKDMNALNIYLQRALHTSTMSLEDVQQVAIGTQSPALISTIVQYATQSKELLDNATRQALVAPLKDYTAWYKFSWFGHHHDARARAVIKSILDPKKVKTLGDALKILLEQQLHFSSKTKSIKMPYSSAGFFAASSGKRFVGQLKNKPGTNKKGGYITAIEAGIKTVNQKLSLGSPT